MKRIYTIIFGALALLALPAFVSCEKELETKVFGQIVPDSFFQTENDLEAAVTGMMVYVSGRGIGTDYGLWTSHWVAPRVYGLSMTDELYRQWSNWSKWIWNPNSGIEGNGPGRPEDNWAVWQFNQKAAKITALLEDFKNCPIAESNPALVEEYSKQLRGLRAFYMYTLYEFFGPVNTIIDPSKLNSTDYQSRMSDAEYIAAIDDDFQEVFTSKLPDVQTGDKRGYVSMDFFRMCAIRFYMATSQWVRAEKLCREILNSGRYELILAPGATVKTADVVGVSARMPVYGPEYDYTYSPFEVAINTCPNKETIFSCPVDTNHGNIWITEITDGSMYYTPGPSAGARTSAWNMGYTPWQHFHDLFGYEGDESYDKDTRVRQFYVKGYSGFSGSLMVENPDTDKGELSMVGAAPYKFTNYKEVVHSGAEWLIEQPAYRLSDVYLYLAECIVRQQGVTEEAKGLVSDIRERAGLPRDLTKGQTRYYINLWGSDPTVSTEAFLHFILWERGRELMGEGQRFEDLHRFKSKDGQHSMFVERAFEMQKISSREENDFRDLMPIPHKIILQSNGVVQQNPGYPTN